MRNIQVVDGAANATLSIFQATDEEFAVIFPDGRDMEIADDLVERVGEEEAGRVLAALWARPVLKRDAVGIHGTLFSMPTRGGNSYQLRDAKWIGTSAS